MKMTKINCENSDLGETEYYCIVVISFTGIKLKNIIETYWASQLKLIQTV